MAASTSPTTNFCGDGGLRLGSQETRGTRGPCGSPLFLNGGLGRLGGDIDSAHRRVSRLPDWTGVWHPPDARAPSGHRSPSVPREQGGDYAGLLLRAFAGEKQHPARGTGRALLRLASLGFVFTARPNLPEDTIRVPCTFNGEVTWLGKLTFSSDFFSFAFFLFFFSPSLFEGEWIDVVGS